MANSGKGKKGKWRRIGRAIKPQALFTFSPLRLFAFSPKNSPSQRIILLILLTILTGAGAFIFPAAAAPAREQVLEDLQYRVDIWILKDAARVGVSLKNLGGGRYRAEVAAEAQGLAKLLSGQRRDNYSTEMVLRRGRLIPLVYREESRRWGKYSLKEYRFDYKHHRLELWQHHEGKGLRRKWRMTLKGQPIYDPLSAFYNLRLAALGRPPREGATIKVRGIPYPRPEEIVIRVGAAAPEGRKVMVRLANRAFKDEAVAVFVIFNEKWVPSRGWARVMSFGKVAGEMLPGGKPLSATLPGMLSGREAKAPGP